MTFTWGFDYLGYLLGWVRKPRKWAVLRQIEKDDWASTYGCTIGQLDDLIRDFHGRKVR